MKNRNLIILALLILPALAIAQEYKVPKSSGRLELHIGQVTVEGHSGNDIIFSSTDGRKEKDDRAAGLRSVSGSGLEDNTGLGINVTVMDKENVVVVNQLKKTNSPKIKVLVPKGVIVSFEYESQYGGDVKFKNVENEIEVSAQYNSVELDNVTGPLTINTIYGHVEASFGSNIKGPVNIVAVYGYVDVSLPQATKADISLNTSYGELLVAPEFKIEVDQKEGMIKYSDAVKGKINGGGTAIQLTANYGKVYLRKK